MNLKLVGENQTGSIVKIIGEKGAVLEESQGFTISGIFEVNPINLEPTGRLRLQCSKRTIELIGEPQEIEIWPALIPSGQYKNFSVQPSALQVPLPEYLTRAISVLPLYPQAPEGAPLPEDATREVRRLSGDDLQGQPR